LAAAAELARASRHPLSRAIALAAGAGPIALDAVETAGEGVAGTVRGKPAKLGRREFVGVVVGSRPVSSHLWFVWGEREPVEFWFNDRVRDDAASTVEALTAQGFHIEMLSGDQPLPANQIALETGISRWFARMMPQDKIERLRALRAAGRKVLMIGDGLNDTAALAQAHASISFGTAAEASQSAADLILQGEKLQPIVEAIQVARAARKRVLENFAFSAIYNVFAVPFAIAGFVTPLIAAIAMSASSLAVTLNALRLAKRSKSA
jgi:Cu2+-exporting ATPase